MQPNWQTADKSLSLHKGDCRLVLPLLDADSFTACVTDPPYHLTAGKKGGSGPASLNVDSPAGRSRVTTGFMGKAWDGGDVALRPETWAEVLRVLRPGAHLLAFGGTRTFHRIACAIEDAGFEIRDCIMWVYGSGFPKSLDVSKAIDKAAGAEREVIGQRTYADGTAGSWRTSSSDKHAQDAWTKDDGDRAKIDTAPATDAARQWSGYGTALKPAWEPIIVARKPLAGTVADNCQTHGCGALNIDGCRIEGVPPSVPQPAFNSPTGTIYGMKTGEGRNGEMSQASGRWPANVIHDGSEEVLEVFPNAPGQLRAVPAGECQKGVNIDLRHRANLASEPRGDSGSAARFFYCAKASKSDRGEGNTHPTVKPLALMSYLVKLVTMPSCNRILDPFAGSGTTLLACYNAFVEAVGIDLESDHVAIVERRAKTEEGKTPLFVKESA